MMLVRRRVEVEGAESEVTGLFHVLDVENVH
jgi:hypothetical protein